MRFPACALLAILLTGVPVPAQPDPLTRPAPRADLLGKLLRDLGHEPKALSPDVFQITIERDRWPVHVMVSLSTDGRRVWLESKFAPVEDPDKVPPVAWKRLLEANEKIGPAHFAFDKSDKRVHLYKSFDHQDLTVERLKSEIEHFDTTVRKTPEYWRGENFKPVETVATPPATSGVSSKAIASDVKLPEIAVPVTEEQRSGIPLQGEWAVTEIHTMGRKTPDEVVRDRRPGLTVNVLTRGYRLPDGKMGVSERVKAELRIGSGRTRTVDVRLPQPQIIPPLGDPVIAPIEFVDEQNRVEQGIYKLDGETLTLCFAPLGQPRPDELKCSEQTGNWLIVLKKVK
jgi:hypothetical protein